MPRIRVLEDETVVYDSHPTAEGGITVPPPPAPRQIIVRHGKGQFGPGTFTFDLAGVTAGETLRLEVAGATDAVQATIYGPAGLSWAMDPAPLIAGAGQLLPAPTAPMDGPYSVEIVSTTPGTLWWP